jgi:formate C-acetyltransferase
MYTFRPATDRIRFMRELIRDRVLRCDAERAIIMTEAYKKYENVVPIIKKPLALYELCSKMTIRIEDFELIVGNKGPNFFSSPAYPEWGVTDWILEPLGKGEWILKDDGLYHNPPEEEVRQTISPEDYEALASIVDYWKDRKIGSSADAWQPDSFTELERLNVSSYVKGGMGMISLPTGHLIAGYKKVIDKGYKAIRDTAQNWIDEHYGDLMGEDIDKIGRAHV